MDKQAPFPVLLTDFEYLESFVPKSWDSEWLRRRIEQRKVPAQRDEVDIQRIIADLEDQYEGASANRMHGVVLIWDPPYDRPFPGHRRTSPTGFGGTERGQRSIRGRHKSQTRRLCGEAPVTKPKGNKSPADFLCTLGRGGHRLVAGAGHVIGGEREVQCKLDRNERSL